MASNQEMEVFQGRLVLLEDGLEPATIVTKDGKIVRVHKGLHLPEGKQNYSTLAIPKFIVPNFGNIYQYVIWHHIVKLQKVKVLVLT